MDHQDVIDYEQPVDEGNFKQRLAVTGVAIETPKGPVVIACMNGVLAAFPMEGEPDSVNFAAYVNDVLVWAGAEPDIARLVTYDEATRKFKYTYEA